jgi:hypothetical protein
MIDQLLQHVAALFFQDRKALGNRKPPLPLQLEIEFLFFVIVI